MPLSVAVGTVIHTVTAVSPDGNGPITYNMTTVGENIASIDSTTGVITITSPATVSAIVSLTITAMDNRTQCPSYGANGAVIINDGGCTTTVTVSLKS